MKNTQISMREVALRMDNVVDKILDTKDTDYNVNTGRMLIKECNVFLSMYRLQIEVAKLSGNKVGVPVLNMD